MNIESTRTMYNLLTVLSKPEEFSKTTATRWAVHVIVSAATHEGLRGNMEASNLLIDIGRGLAADYSNLLNSGKDVTL